VLEVSGLEAGYGRVQVLWDVDLQVGDGEVVALIGSNGAGKTTLLRTISGVLAPLGGEVRWNGESIGGLVPEQVVRRGIAHVPEGRRLFAGLTVRENLMLGAYHVREGDRAADLARVVEMFPRLGERMTQVAGRLSGGEQQMCAIGRGLMSRPKLIMVDELSLGLAPNLAETLMEQLRVIGSEGTSVLLVEQDVDAALECASRGYVLETGEIVAHGKSTELANDPRIQEAYLGVAPKATRPRKE
jgi:branched-chain amino acid transport system ATP-binding protein